MIKKQENRVFWAFRKAEILTHTPGRIILFHLFGFSFSLVFTIPPPPTVIRDSVHLLVIDSSVFHSERLSSTSDSFNSTLS